MDVLITGGAGFIGSHLSERLLTRGDVVVCLDNFNEYYPSVNKRRNISHLLNHPDYHLIEGDIRDTALLHDVFTKRHITHVAHLAAMVNVRRSVSDPTAYIDVNVIGTNNLLTESARSGVTNFIFASTSSVYGQSERCPFNEEQRVDWPLAPYPATKKTGELLGHTYAVNHALNFTALRFFTVYGPKGRPDMTPYMFMNNVVRGEPLTLYNGGDMRRDFTYVDDIIDGIIAALDRPQHYQIYNLGRGEPVQMKEFLAVIEKLTGREAIVAVTPAPSSEPLVTWADISKAQHDLGYNPRVSIQEGLERMWQWFQSIERE